MTPLAIAKTDAGATSPCRATDLDQLCVNTIRALTMDAVQQAKSGHPGTPMALAPLAYVIWQNFLRFDPRDPIWPNRDRFALSNGHASMLLYAMLHLSGVRAVNAKYERLGELAVSMSPRRSGSSGAPDRDGRRRSSSCRTVPSSPALLRGCGLPFFARRRCSGEKSRVRAKVRQHIC